MSTPFRSKHLLNLLCAYDSEQAPLDLSLKRYFKLHRNLGSHDRHWIGETLYGMVRWQGLLATLAPRSWELRLNLWNSTPLATLQQDRSLPAWDRLGLPQWLYEKLLAAYGAERTETLAHWLASPAPITLRANGLKTTRDALLARLCDRFDVSPLPSPYAIRVAKREPLFATPEFKEGLFEVQDEGSQTIAALVQAKPGDQGIDYCAGSGGKSLALAVDMQGRGQLYLHDIRPSILHSARHRLCRAGVQNAQFLHSDHPKWAQLRGKADWILLDVPCTGTGSLRRNPDMKWKLDQPMLERLLREQRTIIASVLPLLKPGGRLIYATCSLLPEENEQQVAHILATTPLTLMAPPLSTLGSGDMDALFGAVFQFNTVSP